MSSSAMHPKTRPSTRGCWPGRAKQEVLPAASMDGTSRGGAEKHCIFKSVSRREHECLVRLVFEPPFERLILRVVEG
jgi:hypothetical protein